MGFPEYDIEYVDGNCLNNRRSNLALTNRKCRKSASADLLSPLAPPINDTKYAKLSRTLELSIHRSDGTTLIPLFGGLHTIIDSVDFDLVKDYTWTASTSAVSNTYYAKTIVYNKDGTKEYLTLHSLLLGKAPEGHEIDHEDMNGLNNRRSNLRISTCQQNTRNIAPQKNCKSGITGVRWDERSNRWTASIGLDRKHVHLGSFSSKEEAAEARWKAEREIDSEFFRGHKIK
jgi:hypothetical protein